MTAKIVVYDWDDAKHDKRYRETFIPDSDLEEKCIAEAISIVKENPGWKAEIQNKNGKVIETAICPSTDHLGILKTYGQMINETMWTGFDIDCFDKDEIVRETMELIREITDIEMRKEFWELGEVKENIYTFDAWVEALEKVYDLTHEWEYLKKNIRWIRYKICIPGDWPIDYKDIEFVLYRTIEDAISIARNILAEYQEIEKISIIMIETKAISYKDSWTIWKDGDIIKEPENDLTGYLQEDRK